MGLQIQVVLQNCPHVGDSVSVSGETASEVIDTIGELEKAWVKAPQEDGIIGMRKE